MILMPRLGRVARSCSNVRIDGQHVSMVDLAGINLLKALGVVASMRRCHSVADSQTLIATSIDSNQSLLYNSLRYFEHQ